MKIELIDIKDLKLDKKNARKHPQKNLDQIKYSLENYGQQKPIVIKDNVVVAGNGTLMAAKDLGWDKIACVRSELTGSNLAAYALVDNRSTETSEWDMVQLPETLKILFEDGINLEALGFSQSDLAKAIEEGKTDPDTIPENVETRCKQGDLWLLGEHRLLCGDSTNVQHVDKLMNGEKADIVYTDPPYGLGKSIANDAPDEWLDVLRGAYHTVHEVPVQFWWCAALGRLFLQAMNVIGPSRVLIWHKPFNLFPPRHGFAWHYEPCLYRPGPKPNENKSDVISMNTIWRKNDPENVGHPTQKPVALVEEMLRGIEGLVVDLFLGSGSTLIACEKTGRKCYGMEIDPHYCDVIIKRWEDFTGKTATYFELP